MEKMNIMISSSATILAISGERKGGAHRGMLELTFFCYSTPGREGSSVEIIQNYVYKYSIICMQTTSARRERRREMLIVVAFEPSTVPLSAGDLQ